MSIGFSINSESIQWLFCGPKNLPKYYKKIKQGHKRSESIVHFINIMFGLFIGIILGPTLLSFIPEYFIKSLGFEKIHIVIMILFTITSGTIISSIFYGISKGSVDIYNIRKYGVSNSQLAPLLDKEIELILQNSIEILNINRIGVISLHETICDFITHQNYKIEKQKLKSAHLLFRHGSISNACKMHPLIAEAVSSAMDDTNLSREFIKRNTNITHLIKHLDDGIACNTIEERVKNITITVEKAMSDLILLSSLLRNGMEGIPSNPVSVSTRTSNNDLPKMEDLNTLKEIELSVINGSVD